MSDLGTPQEKKEIVSTQILLGVLEDTLVLITSGIWRPPPLLPFLTAVIFLVLTFIQLLFWVYMLLLAQTCEAHGLKINLTELKIINLVVRRGLTSSVYNSSLPPLPVSVRNASQGSEVSFHFSMVHSFPLFISLMHIPSFFFSN